MSSKSTLCRSMSVPLSAAFPSILSVSVKIGGKTSSTSLFRLALLKNRSPALRCILHNSPSALMIPFPWRIDGEHGWYGDSVEILPRTSFYLPNKSQDLVRKKTPFMKISLFFNTCSTFRGSLITTPGGKVGTDIS